MGALAVTSTILASAVADDGTFTLAYPAGVTQAKLLGSTGGQMVVDGDLKYAQGASGFTVVFGSSNMTVTNTTGAALPIGSELILSFGDDTLNGGYNPGVRVSGIAALAAATGTAGTVADVGASFSQTTLNNNFKTISDKVDALIAALQGAGTLVD